MKRCLSNLSVLALIVLLLSFRSSLAQPAPGTTQLGPTDSLAAGQSLLSSNGLWQLSMRTDGNLVLSHVAGGDVWSTNTAGSGATVAAMELDGDLVLRKANNTIVWDSGTEGMRSDLLVNDDGTLSIVRQGRGAVWSSLTDKLSPPITQYGDRIRWTQFSLTDTDECTSRQFSNTFCFVIPPPACAATHTCNLVCNEKHACVTSGNFSPGLHCVTSTFGMCTASRTTTKSQTNPAHSPDILSVQNLHNANSLTTVQIGVVSNQYWWRAIDIHDCDGSTQEVWTADQNRDGNYATTIAATHIHCAYLEFKRYSGPARATIYTLVDLDASMSGGDRVTFTWEER